MPDIFLLAVLDLILICVIAGDILKAMQYRRNFKPGGTFFLTVVTCNRKPILAGKRNVDLLRQAFREVMAEMPFDINAIAIMPDHFHAIITLPDGDSEYSKRISLIKRKFTTAYLSSGQVEAAITRGQSNKRNRGIWQSRFWEHTIRDSKDFTRHLEYIHLNPVKHGLVAKACDWLWSSFGRYVEAGVYESDWHGRVDLPGMVEYSVTL